MKEYTDLIQALEASRKTDNGVTFIGSGAGAHYVSYARLYEEALQVLAGLQERGMDPGDELVFQVEDNHRFIVCFWAALLGGIVPVPITVGVNDEYKLKVFRIWEIVRNPYLLTSERGFRQLEDFARKNGQDKEDVLGEMDKKTVFTENIRSEAGKARIARHAPGDLAFIQFSSGSTGEPKGICLSHGNLAANIRAILSGIAVSPEDSSLSWLPLTHDMGLIGFHLAPLAAGVNQFIMPASLFVRNPLLWMEKAGEYRVTVLSSPNFGFRHFLNRLEADDDTRAWDLSCVRIVFNGAEPIAVDLCRRFLRDLGKYGLKKHVMFPVYGLAEASLAVTFPPVGEELQTITLDRNHLALADRIRVREECNGAQFVDVGFPVRDCSVTIRDERGNTLAENTIGLIHIKGENVTRGYYDNKARTDEILDADGWLNTGDLGFVRAGRLVVTGRTKDVIFVNGRNYYPQDVEKYAEAVDGIGQGKVAACGAFDAGYRGDIILLFVVFAKSLEQFAPLEHEIRNAISLHMGLDVHRIIPVKSLPRTTSGKIQRYRLVDLYAEGAFDDVIHAMEGQGNRNARRGIDQSLLSETETKLLSLVRDISADKTIGPDDRLLEAGMDSIKAANLVSAVNGTWRIELPIDVVFTASNVRELASRIEVAGAGRQEIIPAAEEKEYYPLSSSQKRLFILQNLESGSTVYNISRVMIIRGELDYAGFESAIDRLVRRHEALRTSFRIVEGEPVQVISETADFTIEYEDRGERSVEEIARRFIRPFDFSRAPLFRVGLVRMEDDEHLFLFDIHHCIADGSSAVILARELESFLRGKEPPALRLQYKDFASWQNAKSSAGEYASQREYWLHELEGAIPGLDLAADFPRPVILDFNGAKLGFTVESGLVRKLKVLASGHGVTLYMLLMAAYAVLLYRYTGREDILVGTPVAGRHYPGVRYVVGMFVNTIVIRNNTGARTAFCDFLANVKEKVLAGFMNQDYPFEKLVEDLNLTRDMGRNPLFDTMFVLQNMGDTGISADRFRVIPFEFDDGISKFDLTLFAEETGPDIRLIFEYRTALFEKKTIRNLAESYRAVLEAVAENAEIALSEIEVLSPLARRFFIRDYNDTASAYPAHKTVCDLFEEQASLVPGKIAVECGGKTVTYGELNAKADRLARRLRVKKPKDDRIVAIIAEPSTEAVIAVLAVLKAGCAYLPMDPAFPGERIAYVLEDSGAAIVLAQEKWAARIPRERETIFIDSEKDAVHEEEPVAPERSGCNDLAYVIYTSGSTGNPKGVMVEHKSLTNYILWAVKTYVKDAEEYFPLFTSMSFDLTVTSIFTPLASGNTILSYPDDGKEFVLHRIVRENRATVIKLTPSHLSLLADTDNSRSSVKRFIVGGEDLKASLAEAVRRSFGNDVEIYNEYGPTETVVGCMIHKYDPERDRRTSVPIGVPADNVQIYLLDENLRPVPYGRAGELCISGDCVARGYLRNPELTEMKFIDNPFMPGRKMYRSGDLARFLHDGIIEYAGRLDRQVKIRGHRVEPAEIERILLRLDYVAGAVVIDTRDEKTGDYLCAYLVSKKAFRTEEIEEYLSRFLPPYMIPSCFMRIDAIPLTINGKVNTDALPVPQECRTDDAAYLAPRNDTEKTLVDVMADVLQKENIGMNDNFFRLGGDSIKAIRALAKIRSLGYAIRAKNILAHPLLSDMALCLEPAASAPSVEQSSCEGTVLPLPAAQWFFEQDFADDGYYCQSLLLAVKEEITRAETERILAVLIDHHDALRLNYSRERKELYYNNDHLGRHRTCVEYDLSAHSYDVQCAKIRERGEELKSGFDLETDLLIGACLFDLGDRGTRLLLSAHHLLVDAVSWRIILEDFRTLFMQVKEGETPNLGQKTHSLQAWAAALHEYGAGEIAEETDYWRALNEKKPSFPAGYVHAEKITGIRTTVARELAGVTTASLLSDAHKAFGTKPSDLMLTALAAVLKGDRENGEAVIELEGHGREEITGALDITRTTGWFTSMYPACIRIRGNDIGRQIKDVKEQVRCIPGNGIGFGILKYCEKKIEEHDHRYIRFNYLGNLDLPEGDLFELVDEETGADVSAHNRVTASVEINAMANKGRLRALFTCNEGTFETGAIDAFADCYMRKLIEIIEYCRGKTTRDFTPSDFSLVKVTEEDLDTLLA